ncbi:MAG: transcriptional regulator, LysR family [Verrucomicrobia bacterium]|jgi:DNA-binding transcriptional LysR family regulator|nr:transcriptional regulator, LysR family [Verrucomicrobiota bacterium]
MNMRITSLKVFVDLAESGSFSETASRNGITQPAVSQQIGGLEEEFSAQLVERSRRRFRLTPAGEALRQTAQEMLQAIEDLKVRMVALEQQVGGDLQVVTTANLGVEWLPRLMTELQTQHPQIRLQAAYQTASRIYADVAGNVADFALVACPRKDDRFETVIVAEESLRLVASPTSGMRGKPLSTTRQSFVAYTPDPATEQLVQRALQELDYHTVPTLQFEHPDTVVKAVRATNGFTWLPEATVRDALATGELVEIFPEQIRVIRPIAAIFQKQRSNHPILKVVREFFKKFAQGRTEEKVRSKTGADKQQAELAAA